MPPILKCPHCGNEVTPNTRFCAACGSSLVPLIGPGDPTGVVSGPSHRQPGFGPMQIDAAPVSAPYGGPPGLSPTLRSEPMVDKNRTIINVLSAAVVLLSLTAAILAVAWHKASQASSQVCVAEPGMAPEAPPGAGQAYLPAAPGYADDPRNSPTAVADYLNFLQAIDQRRTELQAEAASAEAAPTDSPAATPAAPQADSTSAPADGSPAPTPPPSGAAAPATTTPSTDALWQQLITIFEALSPPSSCGTLATDYLTLLNDSKTGAGKNTGAAASENAVGADAGKAEADMENVCEGHRVTSSFTIAATAAAPQAATPQSP